MWEECLGEASVTSHRKNLRPDAHPFSQRSYRTGPKGRVIVTDEMERMDKAQIFERPTAKWASPAVIVPNHK